MHSVYTKDDVMMTPTLYLYTFAFAFDTIERKVSYHIVYMHSLYIYAKQEHYSSYSTRVYIERASHLAIYKKIESDKTHKKWHIGILILGASPATSTRGQIL